MKFPVTFFIQILLIKPVNLSKDMMAVINEENEMESRRPILLDGNQYINYNSIFYKKMIANNANSTGSVNMRIPDEHGTIIMGGLAIEPGISINLKKLKKNKNYIVEIWVDTGWYMLCFN